MIDNTMNKKAIIICSGGLDSTTLLHEMIKEEKYKPEEILAVSYYYGQRHSLELDCAKYQCKLLNVEHKIIPLVEFMRSYKSALTRADIEVPHIKDVLGDPQPPTYVPFRNQTFLTIICGIAESVGATKIYYGAQMHDLYGYFDCTKEFITRFNNLISLNRKHQIELITPFANFSKAQIAQKAIDLKVDLSHTWSCYNPITENSFWQPNDNVLNEEWVVGFIEGEGCFTRQHQDGKYYPVISVSQKEEEIIEKISEFFNMGSVTKHSKNNGVYELKIQGVSNCKKIASWLNGKLKSEKRIKRFREWINEFNLFTLDNVKCCGVCPTCSERKKAFAEIKQEDGVKYN